VNPKVYFSQKNDTLFVEEATHQPVQSISFDVAVTASEGTKTQGGIAVFTGILGLGSKGQSDKSNESINRLQFTVSISLPIGVNKSAAYA